MLLRIFILGCLLIADSTLAKDLGGIVSPYTEPLQQIPKHWPPPDLDFSKVSTTDLDILPLATPENDFYVGVRQSMTLNAPLDRVAQVVLAYDEYDKYFPTYKEIKIVEKSPQQFITYWDQIVPLFFVPNVKFSLLHEMQTPGPKLATFRYQLKEANLLNTCDGMIVLEADGKKTRYVEYSFSEVKKGILRSMGSGEVWNDSIKSFYLSTVGIRLHVENPDWDFPKIVEESKRRFEKVNVEALLKNRGQFFLLKTTADR